MTAILSVEEFETQLFDSITNIEVERADVEPLLAAYRATIAERDGWKRQMEAIDHELRGNVHDPDPLKPLFDAGHGAEQVTTYGLVSGLLRERDDWRLKANDYYREVSKSAEKCVAAIQRAEHAEADNAAVILALQSLHEYVHGWCEGVPPEHPGSKRWREYDETNREVERVLSQPHAGTALLEELAQAKRDRDFADELCGEKLEPYQELEQQYTSVLKELTKAQAELEELQRARQAVKESAKPVRGRVTP